MRFVRALLHPDTGDVIGVRESEMPIVGVDSFHIPAADPLASDVALPLPYYDMGLIYDFNPVDLGGQPTSTAAAIRDRLEKHPLADSHPDAPKARVRPEVKDLPAMVFCPTSESDIADHLRANGLERIPAIAQAWLQRVLPPDKSAFLGLDASVNLAMLKALESNRRGVQDGGLVKYLEGKIQEQSDARSKVALQVRQTTAAANSAWADMINTINKEA